MTPRNTAASSVVQPAEASFRLSDIVMMDAVALRSAIDSREVSCVEVTTAYLDHIDRLNSKVNAIVARGPRRIAQTCSAAR